uniref:Uncharacterized protein n=1 Tax=Anguilla anguilla TaxID=7936 RepID=A0A0E9PVQ8_ANGAN
MFETITVERQVRFCNLSQKKRLKVYTDIIFVFPCLFHFRSFHIVFIFTLYLK